MEIEELKERIKRIREEIGQDTSTGPRIKWVKDDEVLIICGYHRSDKSMLIGPGGWVVGKLSEEIGKPVTVIESTEELVSELKRLESQNTIEKLLKKAKGEHKDILEFFRDYLQNKRKKIDKDITVVVSYSGGSDSTATLYLLKEMGFNVTALTYYPSDIIVPKRTRAIIQNVVTHLSAPHEYVEGDISEIVKGALEGRYHPCGRCHKHMEEVIIDATKKRGINAIAFGDLLPTGSQTILFKDEIIRINLPSLLALKKKDMKYISQRVPGYESPGYGCPLLKEVHRLHPSKKFFTAQRVLREVRAGVLESNEGLRSLRSIFSQFERD
ncbi:MAG: hypothetical protein APG12_00046 [Candidatus Methanofastidiosum methylothiophilum]|uniref:Rhodanese domain-containing protein n=1 Tax=Candidatus Methanofastidiosum methylothiophilum TaxID=1705564 RepID=A0A150IK62_9EURY|nr:MAG: hypothetical protein APG10_00985 [Candidatus Methanofastidiosum methylthiophilus]KYC48736.1 MAG: hypothetical protein APG11_00047 [Candidatus Methanofastidiosum methylthiophilus]KYC51384.1 MAG: hypothetical protein APG12_00046 [Candidatus Methanofastidiosum methylthiophilus]